MKDPGDSAREFTDLMRFRRALVWLWIRRLFFSVLVGVSVFLCWRSLSAPFPWHKNVWGTWVFEPMWGLILAVVALVIAWFMDVPRVRTTVTARAVPPGGCARRLARRRLDGWANGRKRKH